MSDFAHVLSADSKQALEDYCGRVERATGAQMALVTIPTIEGEPIDTVSNTLYRKWGIGKKGKDEGILLLMAINDHKDRLEIGYGLEPILPDGFVGSVLRSMRPELGLQHYGPAMLTAAEQMGLRIAQAKGLSLDFGLRRPPTAEQQRQAERTKQSEIAAARSAAFVKTNGVAHFVPVEQLTANPFVYQGQVVAVYGAFEQMNSATQGLFSSRDKRFVVSGIPTGRFTQPRSMVMLAGRVLGNIETRLPLLGPTLVPHLAFVGSAFCQQQNCLDYAINLK